MLKLLAVVLADLTYPAKPWQIVAVAESYGADGYTIAGLYRLPVASYTSLGHVVHAYTYANEPRHGATTRPLPPRHVTPTPADVGRGS